MYVTNGMTRIYMGWQGRLALNLRLAEGFPTAFFCPAICLLLSASTFYQSNMNLHNLLCISFFLSVVLGDTTTTASPTWVWVTGTDANGNLATTQSKYTQSFASFYSSVAGPSQGSIGLYSISGSVGHIRTYSMADVTATNAAGPVHAPFQIRRLCLTNMGLLTLALLGVLLL